jgi:hypothetical protein
VAPCRRRYRSAVTNTARHPIDADAGAPTGKTASADGAVEGNVTLSRLFEWFATFARQAPSRLRVWSSTAGAFDTAVCLIYVCFASWLFSGLWPHPSTRAIADNVADQSLIEWFLAHGVLVWKGDFALVTHRLNAPDGVNLMSNASHILHGVLMAPVTVLFGASVSFAILTVVNLAATAAGWYLLLSRTLGLHRWAAFAGGLFAGFAPGMISQSNSHLHMTAQWLVPPIIFCVVRLTRATNFRGVVTFGAGLGLLVAAQLFLGEEVLYLTALVLTLFTIVYVVCRPRWSLSVAPRVLGGIGIGAALALAIVAYPLSIQFTGPQHIPNAPFAARFFYSDMASFVVFSPLSIAGSPEAATLATSSAEYNTYLGLPLIVVFLACVVWRRRQPLVVAAAVTGVVMAYLSMGPHLILEGKEIGFPSLYGLIADIPVIDGALPTRYALALIPLIAIVITVALDAAAKTKGVARLVVPIAVVAALIPLMPLRLATTDRQPIPTFITEGGWRQCTPEGGVLVPVPLPTPQQPDLMRWPAAANAAFAIPEGFFIAPYGPEGRSSIGIYPRPTSQLLASVAKSGAIPPIDDTTRAQIQRDIQYWKADCFALAQVPNQDALRTTLEQLLGPGTPIDDTWTWKVS